MGPERLSKKFLEETTMTRKQRGRPMKKWVECGEEDIERMGITNWKIKAGNKKE